MRLAVIFAKFGATERSKLWILATFGEAAKELRADAIRSRGKKAPHLLQKTDTHACFTESGQEPKLFGTTSRGG
jgi:hypothetical protein